MFRKSFFKPLVLTILLFSAGCTMVGPDFETPDTKVPDKWSSSDDSRIVQAAEEHAEWWKSFNDPVLDELIDKSYKNNLALHIAGLRIYEARAALGRTKGFLYPQVQKVGVGASAVRLSENADPITTLPPAVGALTDTRFENYGLGLDAAWELDIWGRVRRGIESADSVLASSVAGYQDVMVTLTGEVASTYVILRILEERLAVARRNVAVQKRSFQIADVRFRKEMTTELDVQQAKTFLRSTEALIPLLETEVTKVKNIIGLLLAEPPGVVSDILSKGQSLPDAPKSITVGVAGELLRRRPDVRKAELLAAAQSARIGVAKADLYPAFRLVGSVGYVADSTGDVFSGNSFTGVGGFGLMWKFLNYGRLRNKVRIQDARFQQLVAAYQFTVLNAAREVDDALASFTSSQDEVRLKADSAKAAARSVELALILYRDGATDYTTVLDTQRSQLLQQDAVIAAKGKVGLSLIAAYKALGGGWQSREGEDFIPQELKEVMQERTNWGDLLESERESTK